MTRDNKTVIILNKQLTNVKNKKNTNYLKNISYHFENLYRHHILLNFIIFFIFTILIFYRSKLQ